MFENNFKYGIFLYVSILILKSIIGQYCIANKNFVKFYLNFLL